MTGVPRDGRRPGRLQPSRLYRARAAPGNVQQQPDGAGRVCRCARADRGAACLHHRPRDTCQEASPSGKTTLQGTFKIFRIKNLDLFYIVLNVYLRQRDTSIKYQLSPISYSPGHTVLHAFIICLL